MNDTEDIYDTDTYARVYEIKAECSDESRDEVAILSQREKIEVFEMQRNEDFSVVEKIWEIQHETGLDVMGLDLRNLHPDTVFSDEQIELLRSYGAVV